MGKLGNQVRTHKILICKSEESQRAYKMTLGFILEIVHEIHISIASQQTREPLAPSAGGHDVPHSSMFFRSPRSLIVYISALMRMRKIAMNSKERIGELDQTDTEKGLTYDQFNHQSICRAI